MGQFVDVNASVSKKSMLNSIHEDGCYIYGRVMR